MGCALPTRTAAVEHVAMASVSAGGPVFLLHMMNVVVQSNEKEEVFKINHKNNREDGKERCCIQDCVGLNVCQVNFVFVCWL